MLDAVFDGVYKESLKGFDSEDSNEAHHIGFLPLETRQ
jgi:hypothetical protein